MIVLGIDPGTTTVGYSLVEKVGNKFNLIDYGIIETTPKIPIKEKIFEIAGDLEGLIESYKPEKIVIEELFFTNNIKTGIDVAQARGVVIYIGQKKGLIIEEYTPLQLKKGVTGSGKANKLQVQTAIKILFGLESIPKPDDAADAIGLAYMGCLNLNQIKK